MPRTGISPIAWTLPIIVGHRNYFVILALWEKDAANTARIDLWTKDMQVDEMKQFVHQTILTLADSFQKANNRRILERL